MMPPSFVRAVTVRLRNIRGGVFVGEPFRRAFGRQPRTVVVTDFDGSLTMRLNLGEHMQSQIYWYGTYSRNVIFLLKKLLAPGMVVIDGGANVGEISLLSAKHIGSTGKVHAFEPMDRLADQLQWNVDANGFDNIVVHRLGLSDQAGEAPIYVAQHSFRDGTAHDGLGTLFSSADRALPDATIALTTLDAVVEAEKLHRVDLIKLDIEGSELRALQGASELLRRHAPKLVVEVGRETCRAAGYDMDDIVSYLRQFGYSIYRVGRRGYLDPLEKTGLGSFQNLFCAK